MKGYTSIAAIQNYLLTDITANFQPQVVKWIEQIEKYIDNQTGRNFLADSTDSVKCYDGDGTSELHIDDCISISKIEICNTEGEVIEDDLVAGEDYFLEPANDLPKTHIRLYGHIFTKGIQNIKITAKWGYSAAVPDDIVFAATVLVSNIINYSNTSDGEVQSITMGKVTMSFRDPAKRDDYNKVDDILDSYVKMDEF